MAGVLVRLLRQQHGPTRSGVRVFTHEGVGRNGTAVSLVKRRMNMQWITPGYTDMRFGFEITMYIATR
jgi:coenzyme PQQ precursor peptide PqqA